MTKTEQLIIADLARKGFSIGFGKRFMSIARSMEAAGKLPGRKVSVDAYNGNAMKVQWNHPRFIPCYETEIR